MKILKKFSSSLLIGILTLAGLGSAVDTEDPFCEAQCTSCCNVNNSTEFEYLNIISLTYPETSLYGTYTVLDPGTHFIGATEYQGSVYQEVIRYENDANVVFDNNVRIFSVDTQATLNCTESHFYFDGMKFDLERVEAGVFDYCRIAGINGVINRTKLEDYTTTSGVYFAFNRLVEERTDYRIMFDIDNRIIPRDDILDYQYAINATDISTVPGSYSIQIDILVSDINDMPVDGNCLDLDTVMNMSNGLVYVDSVQKCQLDYISGPTGDENDGGRWYRYELPQSRYEECAESFTNNGQTITFSSTLYTPTFTNLGQECFYFQPGSSQQAIEISIDAAISANITDTFEQFSSELIDVSVERCEPISQYIIPQAIIVFTFETTFTGSGTSLDWNFNALPYVSGSSGDQNYLYGYGEAYGPDSGNGQWVNCTDVLLDEQNNEYRKCTFKMKTSQCEKIYTTDSGQCGFERNSTRYIYNMEFREEYSSGLFITHRTPRVDTNLEFMLFPETQCAARDEALPINVNDEFPTSLVVRNYYDRVDVNWTNTSNINFQDQVTLRLSVGEQAGTVLNDLSVMIKTVLVTLRDVNDVILAQLPFNVQEKKNFLDVTWSLYYGDPHFCSWYDAAGTGGDLCQPFYSLAEGRSPAPLTQSDVDHICKRNSEDALEDNSRNVDYFMFNPRTWFVDLYSRPYLKVSFTVNAVIHTCGESGVDPAANDRRRLGQRDLQSNTVRYVSDELVIIFGEDSDGDPITDVIRDPGSSTVATDFLPLIIGVSVSAGVLLLIIVFALCRRSANAYTTVESHTHLY